MEKEEKVNFKAIEKKWQDRWEKKKIFQVSEGKKKKFYVLEMFPYPSGSGLHMGHAFNYIIGDIYARLKRMQGFNVLYPMGYDSLGLPAENAAIKEKIHPRKYTENSIKNFIRQQKELGLSYDWTRLVKSSDPEYYKWDQWIFLQMLKKGLAFRKKAAVNYCNKCKTVLANEQVHDGKCWRHEDTNVEIKQLEQWFFKITDYANELYEDINKLKGWSEDVKAMQKNWIGKSYGSEIDFEIENPDRKLNCIIIHGCPSDKEKAMNPKTRTYDKHWLPWIKSELNKKGIKAEAPLMPEPWKANYSNWKKEFEKSDINENTILVGHSCGCAFLVRWLGETKKKIKKLILVAPWKIAKSGNAPKEFYDYEIDNSIRERVKEIIIFTSNNEETDGKKSVKIFYNTLRGQIIELRNKGHFVLDNVKTEEFPELLNNIIYEKWPIFTTRADTIYGVTFMVISSQHPRLFEIVTEKQKKEVEEFLKKIKSTSEKDLEELEKEGAFTGSYAINPINGEKVPVYTGNFVVADYGSGMVMAVPNHDQRDFEFAKKYNIQIKEVIRPVFGESHKDGVFRKTVSAVIHRKKDNKFLLLKWNQKFSWVSPVLGGIEGKEDILRAAEREVFEETGYKAKAIKKLGGEIKSHYFADHKNTWTHRIDQPVLLELLSEKPEKVKEHKKNLHEAIWLTADEALKKITHEYNKIGLLRYIGKERAFTENGILVNSGKFNGLDSEKAKEEITKFLEQKKLGRKTINFRLKDWLISRQRYWGTPIPIIYCEKCGIVPVSEKQLPVKLPEKVKFGGGNPLATNKEFVNVKCPKCKGKARRETDTMDTFVNSSWYFLRYIDAGNKKQIFDKKKAAYWMPIDQYIGGKEHACMHLIYFRFYTKFLRDLGLLKIDEPTLNLFNQGMLHGHDGAVMSKSRGNVALPEEVSRKYSIDTARLFLMSQASPDKDTQWSENGIQGSYRFVNKVIDYFSKIKFGKADSRLESRLNKAIKEITADIEEFRYNLAIIKLRELFESFETIDKKTAEAFLKMLSLFCPHICEELWEKIRGKGFVSLSDWLKADEKKINKKFEEQAKAIEKLKNDINNIIKIIEARGEKKEKVYVYCLPKEKEIYDEKLVSKKVGKQVKIFSVADKNKYDPTGKSKNSKPGKPAIYVE